MVRPRPREIMGKAGILPLPIWRSELEGLRGAHVDWLRSLSDKFEWQRDGHGVLQYLLCRGRSFILMWCTAWSSVLRGGSRSSMAPRGLWHLERTSYATERLDRCL